MKMYFIKHEHIEINCHLVIETMKTDTRYQNLTIFHQKHELVDLLTNALRREQFQLLVVSWVLEMAVVCYLRNWMI